MARTFTCTFVYGNENYTAVVTQVNGTVSIYVPDERLHHILPQGKFTYDPAQDLKTDSPRLSAVQNLIRAILSSIEALNGVETGRNSKEPGQ